MSTDESPACTNLDRTWMAAMDDDAALARTFLGYVQSRCLRCSRLAGATFVRSINNVPWVTRSCRRARCIEAANRLLEGL